MFILIITALAVVAMFAGVAMHVNVSIKRNYPTQLLRILIFFGAIIGVAWLASLFVK